MDHVSPNYQVHRPKMSKKTPYLSADEVFDTFRRSDRILDDLESFGSVDNFSIVLTKYSEQIASGTEYRCIVNTNVCEGITSYSLYSINQTKSVPVEHRRLIDNYITKYNHLFPETIVALDVLLVLILFD